MAEPESDVDEANEDRYLDERADDPREGLAGGGAEHSNCDRNRELEVVRGDSEGEGGRLRVAGSPAGGRTRSRRPT